MKRIIVGLATCVGVTLLATGCAASSSDSVDPAPTGGKVIKNVVYFGNPTGEIANLGDYQISGTGTSADGQRFVDVAVIFAGNINSENGQWSSDPNSPVIDLLDSNLGDPAVKGQPRSLAWLAPAVKALRADGVTVLLGILPNWDGTGWSCPGMTAATQKSLANDIVSTVNQYGFDGFSIDDEYSGCPQKSDQGPGGDASVTYGILQAVRENSAFTGTINKSMYSDAFNFTTPGYNVAPLLDSAWAEEYPSDMTDVSTASSAGMTAPQLGLSAEPNQSPVTVTQNAQLAVQNNLGYMMFYATDSLASNQDRAAVYTQAVQGEYNPNATVTYTGPN